MACTQAPPWNYLACGLLVSENKGFIRSVIMPTTVDRLFGIHAEALQLRARRGEVLGSNLANADTPGYKARDLDFKAALGDAARQQATHMATTRQGHLQPQGRAGGVHELYRTPNAPSLDGNTVDTQVEQNKFAENAVRYRTSLRFMSGRIQSLMTAIKGE
jgi:flagellar basal-body rod protein FlgB